MRLRLLERLTQHGEGLARSEREVGTGGGLHHRSLSPLDGFGTGPVAHWGKEGPELLAERAHAFGDPDQTLVLCANTYRLMQRFHTASSDPGSDSGELDLIDETPGEVIDVVPAPIAVVSDNGSVIERFFGTLRYEHLYRARTTTVARSRWKPSASAASTTASGRTRPSATGHRAYLGDT
jgi:hypothetical protein